MTKLLMRVYDPVEGRVLVDGLDIRQIKKKIFAEISASVPQEPILFNGTIGYNIGYPLENATKEDIESAAKLANLHDFIITLEKVMTPLLEKEGSSFPAGRSKDWQSPEYFC